MTTRVVDPRTLWAVLAMEAAVALAFISLPTQGDRVVGLAGPLLLLFLLPLGFTAVYQLPALRDPSWRLLIGIGLALLTRLIVSNIPERETGPFVWLGRSVVPAMIGVALWWRGGALAVAELTAADVRTEFSILAICLVAALSLVRPFVFPDPLLLGCAVGLFAFGGLVGTALSRQVAGSVGPPRSSGALAAVTSLVPAGGAVLLVGFLRPELLFGMWILLGQLIVLILTPIGLFIAWLTSFLPRVAMGPPAMPESRQIVPPIDPAVLADAQERMSWLATLIILAALAAAIAAVIFVAKLLLDNWIRDPREGRTPADSGELIAERSGTPGDDAGNFLGWLLRWLRGQFARNNFGVARSRPRDATAVDAWSAYQRLLAWAEQQGLGRRPAETTGQLSRRLTAHAPAAADAVDLVTTTYEYQRYGNITPNAEAIRHIRQALEHITSSVS